MDTGLLRFPQVVSRQLIAADFVVKKKDVDPILCFVD
jgi:hypothetical protein